MAIFSEIAAGIDIYEKVLAYLNRNPAKGADKRVRAALKALYFSQKNIDLIKKLKNTSDQSESEYIIESIAISQRDSGENVSGALRELLNFADLSSVSISAGEDAIRIADAKEGVRGEIAKFLFTANMILEPDRSEVLDRLVQSIERLNAQIRLFDDRVGGTIIGDG